MNHSPQVIKQLPRCAEYQLSGFNCGIDAKGNSLCIDIRVRRSITFMRDNLSSPYTLESVAEFVGLSRSRFFQLFLHELGTSPQALWDLIRLKEAQHRLGNSHEKLIFISLELGFSTPGNFSRFFREHMGVSPSLYRKSLNA